MHDDCAGPFAEEGFIVSGPRLGDVKDQDNRIGGGQTIAGSSNAFGFDGIPGASQAGGVGQSDGPAVTGRRGREDVARRPGALVNDASLIAEQRVDQAALAHICAPGQDNVPRSIQMHPDVGVVQQCSDAVSRTVEITELDPLQDRLQGGTQRPAQLVQQYGGAAFGGCFRQSNSRVSLDRILRASGNEFAPG
jgi:hypothetical protein